MDLNHYARIAHGQLFVGQDILRGWEDCTYFLGLPRHSLVCAILWQIRDDTLNILMPLVLTLL